MGEIKLYDAPTPAYCSCCMGQDERQRHVDFQAECDRGFYGPEGDQITMDDLVLCENDVKTAGRVIGMIDEGEASIIRMERDEALAKVKNAETRTEKAEAFADGIDEAYRKWGIPNPIDHRKRPRSPRIPA